MNAANEFGSRPFVAGAIVGTRSWMIQNGSLTGVRYRSQDWTDGTNEAECHKSGGGYTVSGLAHSMTRGGGFIPSWVPPHEPCLLDCRCGFYAYFDGSVDYAGEADVSGVIEGFGSCVVGDRGFRAARARVIALVVPELTTLQAMCEWSDVRAQFPRVPTYATLSQAVANHPLTSVAA